MGKSEAVTHTPSSGRVGGSTDAEAHGAGAQRLGGTPDAFQWGPYEPAIRRWEAVTGRLAPSPVELGTRGQQRLAAPFVEWLMGLPSGYVTELGLPRSGQLHALGNGVVPQQAEQALRQLLGQASDLECALFTP
jgi:DNA (cytosine-5)-methyltransferase 1